MGESTGPSQEPVARRFARGPLLFVLAVALLHGLVWQLLLPPWQGEDEPWQFEVVQHIARGHWPTGGREYTRATLGDLPLSQAEVLRRFPSLSRAEVEQAQRAILRSMDEQHFFQRVDFAARMRAPDCFDQVAPGYNASNQPPLYYLLAAGALRLAGRGSVERELRAARGLSLVLFVLVVGLCYLAAQAAFGDERPALAAGLYAAFLPMHARQAAIVNNDVLATLWGALGLWLALRVVQGRGRARELVALAVVSALALATKTTAAGVLVLGLLAVLSRPAGMRDSVPGRLAGARGRSGRRAALAGMLGAASLVALGLLAWRAQHNPGLPKSGAVLLARIQQGLKPANLYELWRTLVGVSNWNARGLPASVYWCSLGLLPLGALGALACARRQPPARKALLVCALFALAQLALITLRGVAVGRYLLPCIGSLSVLAAAACEGAGSERWRARALAASVLALIVFDAFFLAHMLLRQQYLVWGA